VLDVFVWDDVGVGEVEFEEDGGADLRVDGYGRVGDLRALVGGRGPEDQVPSGLCERVGSSRRMVVLRTSMSPRRQCPGSQSDLLSRQPHHRSW
jgi:hypothetical protein